MFTIYSLGDVEIFQDTLNAVAMLFNHGDLVNGLGFGAFFGSMVLLCVTIYRSVFEKKINIKSLIVPLIMYIALVVPKTSIVVDDLYRVETPQKIDNVPIGLAIPLSVASGLGKVFANTLEMTLHVMPINGFSVSSGKVTDSGFLTPLQVLNAMRYDDISKNQPQLQKAFNIIYATCVSRDQTFSFLDYERSPNAFLYTINKIANATGVVTIPTYQAGETVQKTVSCSDASILIEAAIHAHMTGDNDVSNLLGPNYKNSTFANALNKALTVKGTLVKNSNNSPITYSKNQIDSMVSGITGLTEAQSRAYMANVIFDPMMKTASQCEDQMDIQNIANCTSFITSTEQWKETSAAKATSFYKNMRNGQNVLILIGIMLFPIAVFILVLQGLGSLKLISGYIIFLITNYLWIPLAVIINYYSQSSFQDALYTLRLVQPNASITLTEVPYIFDIVSNKLAVANNAIGMIPVISTMLFGGGVWAMKSFSNAINPTSTGYNSKLNSPTISSSSPMATGSSLVNKNGTAPASIVGISEVNMKNTNERNSISSEIKAVNDKKSKLESTLSSASQKLERSQSEFYGHTHGDQTSRKGGDFQQVYKDHKVLDKQSMSILASYNEIAINSKDKVTFTESELKQIAVTENADAHIAINKHIQSKEKDAESSNKSKDTEPKDKGKQEGIISKAKGVLKNIGKMVDIGAGVGVSVQSMGANSYAAVRETINPNTKEKTYEVSFSSGSGYESETTSGQSFSGAKIKGNDHQNSSNNFNQEGFVEKIRNASSDTMSDTEKKDILATYSQYQELSKEETALQSKLIAINTDSNMIGGSIGEFNPNNENIRKGLTDVREVGEKNVENWSKLYQIGQEVASKGGIISSEERDAVATYYAGMNSNNVEIANMTYRAVEGDTPIAHSLSGILGHDLGSEVDSKIQGARNSIADADTKENQHKLDQSSKHVEQKIGNPNHFIQRTKQAVSGANNLTNQHIDDLKAIAVKNLDPQSIAVYKDAVQKQGEIDLKANEQKGLEGLKAFASLIGEPKFSEKVAQVENDLRDAQARNDMDAVASIMLKVNNLAKAAEGEVDKGGLAMLENYNAQNPNSQISINNVNDLKAEREKQSQILDNVLSHKQVVQDLEKRASERYSQLVRTDTPTEK